MKGRTLKTNFASACAAPLFHSSSLQSSKKHDADFNVMAFHRLSRYQIHGKHAEFCAIAPSPARDGIGGGGRG
jgi:hypothetical protein